MKLAGSIGLLAIFVLAAGPAWAQLHRWTDEQGRTQITDTPGRQPAELAHASRAYPVTLHTTAECGAPCEKAREALKRRGVPFNEVTGDALEFPTLKVGRSVHRGFDQVAYDALLDAARYPKGGAALRAQGK